MIIENPTEFRTTLISKFYQVIRNKKTSATLERAIYYWSIQQAKNEVDKKIANSKIIRFKSLSIYFNILQK